MNAVQPPAPPSDSEVTARTGFEIDSRETVRRTELAVVERLRSSTGATAILKTVLPGLRHEIDAHRAVSGMEICAAPLIAAGEDAAFPWLLMDDIDTASLSAEPRAEDIAQALEMLAEFHARAQVDVQDRSVRWLSENTDALVDQLNVALGPSDGEMLKRQFQALTSNLARLADAIEHLPLTPVHGDFDPGNLAYSRGKWRAIDWGLAHRNIPLVDVAHMVMRFDESTRHDLFKRYLNAAALHGVKLAIPPNEQPRMLALANDAHIASFLYWHSYCSARLGIAPDAMKISIVNRLNHLTETPVS